MKLNLSFEFDNSEQAEAFLRLVRERANAIASPPADHIPGPPDAEEAPPLLPAHKTPGKRRKAKVAEKQTTAPAPLLEPAKVTLEDVQKKVEAVFEARGMTTARDLLSRFGVQKVRDLLPAAYADLVAHADKVLAGAAA